MSSKQTISQTELNIDDETKTSKPTIFDAIKEIGEMPYYKNGAAESGNTKGHARHEDAIKCVLIKHGITCQPRDKKWSKKDIENWIKHQETCPLPNGSFVEQPCGTHCSPDFIVRIDDKNVIGVEAKSSEEAFPLYNSGGVKGDYLYVFCSNKYNETTLYWGRDIISNDQQETIKELHRLQKEIEERLNKLIKEQDQYNRGWSYYTRPMINQSGGSGKTDYFKHPDRKQCEANVYSYFKKFQYS